MRILLAVDGSRYSVDVVDAVIGRARPEAGLVRVLSAVDPEQVIGSDSSRQDLSEEATQTPMKAT